MSSQLITSVPQSKSSNRVAISWPTICNNPYNGYRGSFPRG